MIEHNELIESCDDGAHIWVDGVCAKCGVHDEYHETCPDCGGRAYETYNQGQGLVSFACSDCGRHFQIQYEWDDDLRSEDEYEWPRS